MKSKANTKTHQMFTMLKQIPNMRYTHLIITVILIEV